MSITTANGHAAKRRKLSHGSGDDHGQSRHSTVATGGITKSSVLQLQINELLQEIKPDYDSLARDLLTFAQKFTQHIKSSPDRPPCLLPVAEKSLKQKHGIAIPFGSYRPDAGVRYKFEYKQPECFYHQSGITQRLGTADTADVEIAVQMPSALFQDKDYLNHRALHKRAYYLACLAASIKDHARREFEFAYDFQFGNEMAPILVVKPLTKELLDTFKGSKIIFNAIFPDNMGPVEKMTFAKNCLRSHEDIQSEVTNLATPTPFYNSTIRTLASVPDTNRLLSNARGSCEAFGDACLLGQTWLRQRGFASDISAGGFGWVEWAQMCALLLIGGGHKGHPLFSARYSSLQLFKAMLQVLATRDLSDPLLIRAPNLQAEKENFPVLYDGLRGVNLLSKVSQWSYEVLKHEAQISLAAINSRALNSFESCFITKVLEPNLRCDEVYGIEIAGTSVSSKAQNMIHTLYTVLKQGLGDRISLLDLGRPGPTSWSLTASEPKQTTESFTIEVRLLVNADATARLIDHGPTAEQQDEAKKFRKFWGEKAELRRFRDGSITETLVWSSTEPVTLQIIRYLCAYHFKILPNSIMLKTPNLQAEYLPSNAPISAENAFKLVNNKYQELSSKLHQMEGLPLPIRSVSPASQALRSAATNHPLDPSTSQPIDILIQFDSSARWPDHLLAIQHTKVAFLAKISDLIKESDSSLDTRIGLENTNIPNAEYNNTSFLDIILPSPAPGLSPIVFRLRIHHEREIQLLQNLVTDKSLLVPHREIVSAALLEHKRIFIANPTHTTTIRNLITHFPPLSSTIRLLKSWIASHNLSNHIHSQALEIIAAHIFLHPYPWTTPGNATTAFLRCLHFLSHWDWVTTPLIIDLSLSQDMTGTQTTDLDTRFQAWRKLDPNMNTVTWFIGTNADPTGAIWTQGARPPRVIAIRTTALAKAAIELVKSNSTNMQPSHWKNLFTSPLSDFDFVLYVKKSLVRGRQARKNDVKFKNLQVQLDLDADGIGQDVVALYVGDLERAFGNAVMFFYGEGSRLIAGLWRPGVGGSRDWRVRLGYSTVPYAGEKDGGGEGVRELAEINTGAMLAEMSLLGEGMIDKISVKSMT